ncbi:MAG: quinone oxidoreductase family protein [Candidatus Limnocylindria bacterium]
MRAVVVEQPGGLDRLQLLDRPAPEPGPQEVLVRVAYAAVNWSDVQKRQGIYPDPVTYPAVLGAEVAGEVIGLGPDVPRRLLHRRVAALCGAHLLGGCADSVAVPRDYLIPVPSGIGLASAAALPLAALTAYHLLHTAHRLRRGEVILVHAAAGSVGLALTQLAHRRGVKVIGTVGGPGKVDVPRRYGASLVIDRSREDFVEAAMSFTDGRGVDLVIDSLGGEILPRSFDCLRRFGRLINIGEASGEPAFPVRKKLYERSTSMAGFEVLHATPGSPRWRRGVRSVAAHAARGELSVPIDRIVPLAEVARAHAALESRQTVGKILLDLGVEGVQ